MSGSPETETEIVSLTVLLSSSSQSLSHQGKSKLGERRVECNFKLLQLCGFDATIHNFSTIFQHKSFKGYAHFKFED